MSMTPSHRPPDVCRVQVKLDRPIVLLIYLSLLNLLLELKLDVTDARSRGVPAMLRIFLRLLPEANLSALHLALDSDLLNVGIS